MDSLEKSCKWREKERGEDPGLERNLNLGPPEAAKCANTIKGSIINDHDISGVSIRDHLE